MLSSVPIYRERYGQGKDLVLVHGWGMHTGMWRDFAMMLSRRYRVTCLDLPGHGRSPMTGDFSVAYLGRILLEAAPERAVWIGWSLGATLVLNLARCRPDRVEAIVLVAGNPRFTRTHDWPGLDPRLLDTMASNLEKNFNAALLRFLSLQTAGLASARHLFKDLRQRLLECKPTDIKALNAGLDILKTADLRLDLQQSHCPVLAIFGGKDTLVPVQCAEGLRLCRPDLQLRVIDQAGHMPFASHPKETLSCLLDFLQQTP